MMREFVFGVMHTSDCDCRECEASYILAVSEMTCTGPTWREEDS